MIEPLSFRNKYGKAILSTFFAIYTAVVPFYSGDHHLDSAEVVLIAIATGNAIMVYVVPVTKKFPGLKSVTNALLSGLVVLQTVMGDGVDLNETAIVIGAVLAAFGVVLAPATSAKEGVWVGVGSDRANPL